MCFTALAVNTLKVQSSRSLGYFGWGIALLAASIVVIRLCSEDAFKRFDSVSLAVFAVGAIGPLLPRLKNFKTDSLSFEFAEPVTDLKKVDPQEQKPALEPKVQEEAKALELSPSSSVPMTIQDWAAIRQHEKARTQDIYLVHVITPSKVAGQKFDIFLYLVCQKGRMEDLVKKAEFFFGRYWDNKVFDSDRVEGKVGIRTSAYGPFLAICQVHLNSGEKVIVTRYVDFEMGKVYDVLAAGS